MGQSPVMKQTGNVSHEIVFEENLIKGPFINAGRMLCLERTVQCNVR